jgi:hypothetical protein
MSLPASKISPVGNYRQQPNKALISTKVFNAEFFSYSTYVDSSFNTRGTLAVNSAATAALCPAGRILHANGKFLNTGVNPDVTKYYMGVLDSVTGLNGYIDPASATFANYDVNLPVQYDGGVSSVIPALGGKGAAAGFAAAPLVRFTADTTNTSQSVTDVKGVDGVIENGMIMFGLGSVAFQVISAYTGGTTLTVTPAATATAGDVSFIAVSHGTSAKPLTASAGVVICDGTSATTVYTSAVTTKSIIILTQNAMTGVVTTATAVVSPGAGSFTVTASADSAWNYLIIN